MNNKIKNFFLAALLAAVVSMPAVSITQSFVSNHESAVAQLNVERGDDLRPNWPDHDDESPTSDDEWC